jgi:hypothetical protein
MNRTLTLDRLRLSDVFEAFEAFEALVTMRIAICLIFMLAAAPFAANSAYAGNDAGAAPISLLPASGVANADRAARQYGNVENNLDFDVSKQAGRDAEARLRAMIPLDAPSISTPGTINGPKSRVAVIPRAAIPGPNAAPYTQINRMGGAWGAATVNMPAQQAREYEARREAELAERDRRIDAARHPEVRFNIPRNDAPQPSPGH